MPDGHNPREDFTRSTYDGLLGRLEPVISRQDPVSAGPGHAGAAGTPCQIRTGGSQAQTRRWHVACAPVGFEARQSRYGSPAEHAGLNAAGPGNRCGRLPWRPAVHGRGADRGGILTTTMISHAE